MYGALFFLVLHFLLLFLTELLCTKQTLFHRAFSSSLVFPGTKYGYGSKKITSKRWDTCAKKEAYRFCSSALALINSSRFRAASSSLSLSLLISISLRLLSSSSAALIGTDAKGLVPVKVPETELVDVFPCVRETNRFKDELEEPDEPEAVAKRYYK